MRVYSGVLASVQKALHSSQPDVDDGIIIVPNVLNSIVTIYEPVSQPSNTISTTMNMGPGVASENFGLSPGIWRMDGMFSLTPDPGGMTQFRQRIVVESTNAILFHSIVVPPASFSWSVPYILLREQCRYIREPIGVPIIAQFASTLFSKLL